MTKEQLFEVLKNYDLDGELVYMEPYGDGHINDTFKLKKEVDGKFKRYILQRINIDIFKDFDGLMSNVSKVTEYLSKVPSESEDDITVTLTIIPTKDGKIYFRNESGVFRMYDFVEDTVSHSFASDMNLLYEAGYAFGDFQKKLSGFDASLLIETIPNFHNTVDRYRQLKEAIEQNKAGRLDSCKEQIEFALEREELASRVLDGMEKGYIKLRVTHNDTKINNVLFDKKTGKAKCVIDLDTVMPGSVLYDFGDAIRSCGSTLIEDAKNIEDLRVDFDSFEAYSKGFLNAIGDSLTEKEVEMLPFSAILMTLECGVRFLTDYLNGDTYFKTAYEDHNLVRTKNQFKYVSELEKGHNKLLSIINNIL